MQVEAFDDKLHLAGPLCPEPRRGSALAGIKTRKVSICSRDRTWVYELEWFSDVANPLIIFILPVVMFFCSCDMQRYLFLSLLADETRMFIEN